MSMLTQTLLDILKIESITGNEKALCDFIEAVVHDRFPSGGLQIKRIKNNLVVTTPRLSRRKTIAMAGHLDTVPGSDLGERVHEDQGRIIGLGASDMKGGLAIMLNLLRIETIQHLKYNLIQIYYSGEEGVHANNGLHDLFCEVPELPHIDFCFVLEPTNESIHLGCMGSVNADIIFKGKRCHSARPWEGENAVHKAGRFLDKLYQLRSTDVTIRDLVFRESCSVTLACGGEATNIVPGTFTLNLNTRFSPRTTSGQAIQKIHDLVDGQAEIVVKDISPSCPVPEHNPILTQFKSRFQLVENPKQAYTDVALFAKHGIDAINYGPGLTAQAHQNGEYIPIRSLESVFNIYRKFLCGE